MKKILDFLRNLKLPSIRLGRISFPRLGNLWGGLKTWSLRRIMVWGVAIVAAVGVFLLAQNLTACWRVTPLPGIPLSSCAGESVNPLGTPVVSDQTVEVPGAPPTPQIAAPEVDYPKWDGGSRVNIVFFGLRGGDTSEGDCPQCTDTIIVFTVDPATRTAGMISVPRDMYVNIPGTDGCSGAHDGFCRINTAWTTGEALKLPGGGPGLAMKTVSLFLGVPIQYYAQVDFDTFVQMIVLIGGVDIYNDENLVLDRVGSGNDKVKLTCCGMRHLTGKMALAYARGRHTADGDVDRSRRQQKLILAIRDKVLDPTNFPRLMAEAPQLYNTFQAGIRTNMSLEDGLKLAALMREIPLDQIRYGVIDSHMVNFGNVTLGGQNAAILLPIPDKIRELRDQIFTATGPTSPVAQGDPKALMQADNARIEVTNNTFTAGLDQRTGNFLLAQGMQVTALGPPTGGSNSTVVVVYSPKLYALRYLIQPLGMISASSQIIFNPDPSSPVDLEIRLGNDWASKLPAGY
jgi:polyisoprenyl-teichoic acid--peptidoglycan teichoic acid transferase